MKRLLDDRKMAFVEVYSHNRERMNMMESLGMLYDEYVLPLQSRITELENNLKLVRAYFNMIDGYEYYASEDPDQYEKDAVELRLKIKKELSRFTDQK